MVEVAGMQFRRPALFSNIVLCATTLCRFGLEYEDDWNEIYSALEQSTFKEAIHYGSGMSSVHSVLDNSLVLFYVLWVTSNVIINFLYQRSTCTVTLSICPVLSENPLLSC